MADNGAYDKSEPLRIEVTFRFQMRPAAHRPNDPMVVDRIQHQMADLLPLIEHWFLMGDESVKMDVSHHKWDEAGVWIVREGQWSR